jgi:hypothetical protein
MRGTPLKRSDEVRARKTESGLVFLWILFLLVIMTTLCLTFLQKISVGTQATATRGDAMQAKYLSEAAADRATWRLLNEPGFPASDTVYYMHSKGDGRYGYKVRKPTLTKFGTDATVGAVGNVVKKNSYVQYLKPYDIITAYERFGQAPIPACRQLLGATYVDPTNWLNIGPGDIHYMTLKGCPIRKEIIMGTLDESNDINFAVWDGVSWGNLIEFTQDTGIFDNQCFDIAYENLSGDALVVGRYAALADVRYNIWDGNAWAFATAQIDANLTPTSTLVYVDMASKPNSDEILIALVDGIENLKVVQWDGSSFIDHGEIEIVMSQSEYGSAEVVYEQQSGDALVLWTRKNSSEIYTSVWDGAALTPVGLAQLPNCGTIPYVIRAAADPMSDYIFVAAVDKFLDLTVAVRDGNSWIDSREIETAVNFNYGQVLDVAWEHSGEEVMVAWPTGNNSYVRYFTWKKGTALTDHTVKTGSNFSAPMKLVRLSPIANTEKIILLVGDTYEVLLYSLWTGNTFLGNPAIMLESNFGPGGLPFGIAESGVTPYTGGSG